MVQRLWAIAPGPKETQTAADAEAALLTAAALAAVLQNLSREPGKWRHLHLCLGFPAPPPLGEPPASALVLAFNTDSHVLHVAELRTARQVEQGDRRLVLTPAAGQAEDYRLTRLGAAGPLRAQILDALPTAGPAQAISCRRVLWLPTLAQPPLPGTDGRLITGATARPLQVFGQRGGAGAATAPVGHHADAVFGRIARLVSEAFGDRRRLISDRRALRRLAGLPDEPTDRPPPYDAALDGALPAS